MSSPFGYINKGNRKSHRNYMKWKSLHWDILWQYRVFLKLNNSRETSEIPPINVKKFENVLFRFPIPVAFIFVFTDEVMTIPRVDFSEKLQLFSK